MKRKETTRRVGPTKKQNMKKEKVEAYEDYTIEHLSNAIYFFLQCVFIIHIDKKHRLVVIHNNRLWLDQSYGSIRGAKIAFTKFFNKKAWDEEKVKADWTHDYSPLKDWMFNKMAIAGKGVNRPQVTL